MCEARNFAACVDEIYGVRREICSVGLEGGFSAAQRRSKICSVKYDAEFCSAAHGDKIYGAMADDKIFDVVSARAGNFELQNACVNLRPRNTYADLKFKGSADSEPAGDLNSKFKNGASFGFLCGGNARSLKSNDRANALSSGGAMEISAIVSAGEILKYGVTAGISALALASKILIPSIAGKILNLSAAPRTDVEFKGAGACRI
ncbi:hypothetical protein [uncultured Campylobacter sp.]|uniref:hypothetical protein n=1 Tax=uncultured Campylobacter sp. TaxID=218934 RepID=UPI002614AF0C|nr:hypothetical protein [uncultured Campylobacter sp.]